jgi:phage-related protein
MLTQVIPAFIQIRGVVSDVMQHAFVVFAPIIEKVIPPLVILSGIIANNVAGALKFLMPYVLQAAKAIGGFAEEIMDRIAPIIISTINGIKPVLQDVFHYWGVVWPGMSMVLQGVFKMIVGVLQVAWAIISGLIKISLDIISGNWGMVWKDMGDMFKGIWEGIKTYISGVLTTIKGEFTTIWASLADNIGKPFTDAWAVISDVFDKIKAAISWVTGQGPTVSANTSNIMTGQHHFASGVENFKGGLAVVGEQGPELVNLPRGSSVLSNSKTMALMSQAKSTFQYPTAGSAGGSVGGGGAPIIHVHVHPVVQPNDIHVDGHQLTNRLAPHIAGMIRLKGDVRSR